MDDVMIATQFENIDQRLDRIGQILPTLATRDELRLAIAPLAMKEELQLEIAKAVEPLATRIDVQELRRQMNVLFETLRADIQLLAGHVTSLMPRSRE